MDQAIAYLKQLPYTEVKPGLDRIRCLLEAVGTPHERLRAVHIAGTNGKGSVAVMLAHVLQSAGYRVGLYTSPHLISHCERIQLSALTPDPSLDLTPRPPSLKGRGNPPPSLGEGSGERSGRGEGLAPITEREFAQLADALMPIADSMTDKPTQFEFLTAIAFLYFARHKIDIAVVEVGLGGRFDATNVITPWVSVLTNVALDHTDLLGDTIEKIAWEEAGIAKKNVPLVTGERKREALAVIERECATVGAPLVPARDRTRRLDFTWDYQEFEIASLGRVRVKLLGGYQEENLAVALEALRVLQEHLEIPAEAIMQGLERAWWPGRFEVVQREPYVIVLDGAHNPHAVRALRDDLRRYREKYRIKKSVLLFGVLKDKDYQAMAQTLFPEFDEILLVKPDSPRALDPEVLLRWAPQGKIYPDVATGVARAREMKPDLLCVTGSLYLVGAVKRFFV